MILMNPLVTSVSLADLISGVPLPLTYFETTACYCFICVSIYSYFQKISTKNNWS